MIELIKSALGYSTTLEEQMERAERLHYNYFRQMISRTSDGYYEIEQLKERDFHKLLEQYLKFKIKEDEN